MVTKSTNRAAWADAYAAIWAAHSADDAAEKAAHSTWIREATEDAAWAVELTNEDNTGADADAFLRTAIHIGLKAW